MAWGAVELRWLRCDVLVPLSLMLLRTGDDALYRSSGNGAGSRLVAEVAQGRGWWLFAPTHMGCFLLYHLYPFSDFFFSKLIDSLLVGSNLFATRAEVASRSNTASPSIFSSSFHQVHAKYLSP